VLSFVDYMFRVQQPTEDEILLSESSLARTTRQAHKWSTGTFLSLVWLGATGAAGGVLGSHLYSGKSWVAEVAVIATATVIGILCGYVLVVAAVFPFVIRNQRDEVRKRLREQRNERAAEIRRAIHAGASDVQLLQRRVADAMAYGDQWADGLIGVPVSNYRKLESHERVFTECKALERPYRLIEQAYLDFDRVYGLSYVRKNPEKLAAVPSQAYPDGLDAAAQQYLGQLSEDLVTIQAELEHALERVEGD
jgi:hypothetical protein